MSSGYFAEVVDGVVCAVIRADADFIASNPNLFSGTLVEVPDMANYPAIGWTWTETGGFTDPSPPDSMVEPT